MPLFGPLQTDSLLVQLRPGSQGRPPFPGGLQTRGLVNFVSSSPEKFNSYRRFIIEDRGLFNINIKS